ncbi:MAG: hypothetical protein HFF05_02350 [Oscillospiraceae bacterium]|nr:hypothetical protein [Oscillospiraceae bacterium]
MTTYRNLSRFVLTRGLALCALLLSVTLLLLLRAAQGGPQAPTFLEYAALFRQAALYAFASATIGSLLMEDLLRYYGE